MRRRLQASGGASDQPALRHERRGRGRARRLAATGAGVALVWGALGALGYVGGWQLHARAASGTLVRAERTMTRRAGETAPQRGAGAPGSCVVSAPRTGELAGLLVVPAIHLTAPVEEGTSDAVLSVAVGHDPSSVWPGATGTAALLAHDVSYFVHLGALHPGDTIEYETACSTTTFTVVRSQVVQAGTPLPDSTGPALVLDTCYPSNALFFTSQRLLVWADETGTTALARRPGGPVPAVPPSDQVSYEVPAPAALVAQGLTLQQNEAPMGTMTLSGQTSPGWEQSPGPLDLEAAALEAYFGGLHAMAQTQTGWWNAIAEPGLAPPPVLRGATVTGHDAPLDVTIALTHGAPTAVVLTTQLTLSGGPAPGTYDETVTAVVRGATVLLGGWTMRPA